MPRTGKNRKSERKERRKKRRKNSSRSSIDKMKKRKCVSSTEECVREGAAAEDGMGW